MKATWYYLNTGKRQHVVGDDELQAYPNQTAICGRQVLAFLPAVARWQNDAAGLAERDKCKQCVEILERQSSGV